MPGSGRTAAYFGAGGNTARKPIAKVTEATSRVPRWVIACCTDWTRPRKPYIAEFTAVPGLVRKAPAGDARRAKQLATHVEFLIGFLHGHHQAEDDIVWPKILERGSVERLVGDVDDPPPVGADPQPHPLVIVRSCLLNRGCGRPDCHC